MSVNEVIEIAVRQIIKSGRDVKVSVYPDNPYGRSVEIMGFTTEDEQEPKENEMWNEIACDYCKYGDLFEDEYPCSQCKHNALDYFERRHDEKTD